MIVGIFFVRLLRQPSSHRICLRLTRIAPRVSALVRSPNKHDRDAVLMMPGSI